MKVDLRVTGALLIVMTAFAPAPTAGQGGGEPTLEALRGAAQERMRQDLKSFTRAEFSEIEELYQSANRDLRAPAAREALKQLVLKYPVSNRTGCAVLYLAQISAGAEREAYLKKAIADHADARYGDGAQVGALGRWFLAMFYADAGRFDEAQRAAEELVALFPGAVDHNGGRLIDSLRQRKLVQ